MVLPDDGEPRIGMNVRAARRSRGMSLETLAGLIGRSKGWLSKIENGHARLERRQDIAAIARALGVSADGWLGEPAPEIRPDGQMYNVMPLQRALLDAAPEAVGGVVVDHANGLHKSVRNRRTDELKPMSFAFLGQQFRFRRSCWRFVII